MHRNVIRVDVLNLTQEQSKALAYFLNQQHPEEIQLGNCYLGKIPQTNFDGLEFNHRLIKRKRDRDQQEYVYDIVGDKINQGGQGFIYESLGTLHFQNKTECFLNKSVVRFIKEEKADLTHEYELANRTNVLSVKKPTVIIEDLYFDKKHSLMTMKRIDGEPLNKIITFGKLHSTNMRLELATAILKAVRKYIHKKNITHCDLKETNIMVDLNSKPIKVTIIDFGASKSENDRFPTAWTPTYCPPEFFKTKTFTQEGDIFSLAGVLSRVFGADEHPIIIKLEKIEQDPERLKKYRKNIFKANKKLEKQLKEEANHRKFRKLFNNINDLSKEHKKQIGNLLSQMVSKYMEKRPSLAEIIGVFERIIDERQHADLDESTRQYARVAHGSGIFTRHKLENFETLPINLQNIDIIIETLLNDLHSIQDTPQMIGFFMRSLSTSYLIDTTNIDDVKSRLKTLINNFKTHCDKFNDLKKDILILENAINQSAFKLTENTDELTQLMKDITNEARFFDHKVNRELTIDNLKLINDKLTKFNQRLELKIDKANDLIDSLIQQYQTHVKKEENNLSVGSKMWRFFTSTYQYYVGTPPTEKKTHSFT